MAAERYQVYVDAKADGKLAAHTEFLARVSESAALRLYESYAAALGFIGENAPSCPIYTPQKPTDAELRYWLFGKRYRIVFEIVGRAAYIYDIQDCRQDTDKNLV
ncbi:MAG: hypothetical protein LBN02_03810 [Oscillospiraceae bacterium]|jgi:hypothetical protein|nr:hypothetical protein [Oscillospiraceae bacterium]